MKKLTIIGILVALVIVGGWLWLHFKYPSDSQIQHRIIGTWIMNAAGTKTLEYKTDGHYILISPKRTNEGTWKVEDGFIITGSTNTEDGEMYRDKIVSIDNSVMVMRHDSQQSTNFISAHKR
jgi:SET domain-containing protein